MKNITLITMASYGMLLTILCSCQYVKHNKERNTYNPIEIKLNQYIKDKHIASVISKTKFPLQLAAIAKVESSFRPLISGDGGDSFGLYQIQKKHHGAIGESLEEQTAKAEEILETLIRRHGATKALSKWNGNGKQARIHQAKVIKEIKQI